MDTVEDQKKRDQEDPWAPIKRAAAPFTWFFGAISLINLFNDLDIVEIRSQVFGWLDNYKHLVETIGEFVLGWTGNVGLPLSLTDMHVLAVWMLLTSPVRSALIWDRHGPAARRRSPEETLRSWLLHTLLTVVLIIALGNPTTFLPGPRREIERYVVLALMFFVGDLIGDVTILRRHYAAQVLVAGFIAAALVMLDRIFVQIF